MQNSPTSKNGQLEQKEKLSPEVLEAVNLCDASFKDYKSNAFAVELAALKSFIGTVNGLSAAFAILFKVIDDPKKVMKGRRIRRAATIRAQHDYQVSYALKLPTNAILKHKKFHYFKNEGVWSYIFLNADDNPSDPEFNPKINRLDELKGSQTLLSKMNVESFNPFACKAELEVLFRDQVLGRRAVFYSSAVSELSVELAKVESAFTAAQRLSSGEKKQAGSVALTDHDLLAALARFQFALAKEEGGLHLIRPLMAAVDKLHTKDKEEAGLKERQSLQQSFEDQLNQVIGFYDSLRKGELDKLCKKHENTIALLDKHNDDGEEVLRLQAQLKVLKAERAKCQEASVFLHLLSSKKSKEEFDELLDFYKTATPALIKTFTLSCASAKKAASLEKELSEYKEVSAVTNAELRDLLISWRAIDSVAHLSGDEDEASETMLLLKKVASVVDKFEDRISPLDPSDVLRTIRASHQLGEISVCWWILPVASTAVGLSVALGVIKATVFIGVITATPPGWAVALTAVAVGLSGFLMMGLAKLFSLLIAHTKVKILLRDRLDTKYSLETLGPGESSASFFAVGGAPGGGNVCDDDLLAGKRFFDEGLRQ